MRGFRLILTIILLCFAPISAIGVGFEVPENYELTRAPESYVKYNQAMVDCVDWLVATPLSEQAEKRVDANKFAIDWIVGCPYISIELTDKTLTFIDSPELASIFIVGWARAVLQDKGVGSEYWLRPGVEMEDTRLIGTLGGIGAAMEFYLNNRDSLQENADIERYIEKRDAGSLRSFIESALTED